MRYTVLSAFVNMVAGAVFYAPGGAPAVLARGARVTPPGEFETPDTEQAARLVRARCLCAQEEDGATGAETTPPASSTAPAAPVLHGAGESPPPPPPPASGASATATDA